ncbi:MAG: hypothetical protein NT150_15600 [Bacteroidetes bacterium]|nr:hypothetical protein [Bacteroidota bacterium]
MKDQKTNTSVLNRQKQERKNFLPSERDIKNFIQQNLEIGHIEGKVSSLIRENESALTTITGFESTSFFRSEKSTFQFLSEYYKKKEPNKKILYLGFPQKFSQPNFSYIYQLRGAKAFLSERTSEVAALILDPLLLIQKSVDYNQRIHSLRTLCSGSDIPFFLDERKTIARIHQKGLNFIFQFQADALLLGENLSLGIPLGALAHSPDFFDEAFLPGTFAPKAEGLLACKKITENLNNTAHRSFLEWNAQGTELCESLNKKLKNKFPFGLMNNFGSILWLNNFGCNRALKKLQQQNILKGSERCLYLPPGLNEEERNEIMNEIIKILSKRKAHFKKMKQAKLIQQKILQII